MRNGLTVFREALRPVFSASGAALRIVAVPSLVRLGVHVSCKYYEDPKVRVGRSLAPVC